MTEAQGTAVLASLAAIESRLDALGKLSLMLYYTLGAVGLVICAAVFVQLAFRRVAP